MAANNSFYSNFPAVSKDLFIFQGFNKGDYETQILVKCLSNQKTNFSADMVYNIPLSYSLMQNEFFDIEKKLNVGDMVFLGFGWNSYITKNGLNITKCIVVSLDIVSALSSVKNAPKQNYKEIPAYDPSTYETALATGIKTQFGTITNPPAEEDEDDDVDWELNF